MEDNSSLRTYYLKKLKEEVAKIANTSSKKITLDTRLEEELGMDSIDKFELAFCMEDLSQKYIKDEIIPTFKTPRDYIDYIISLKKG